MFVFYCSNRSHDIFLFPFEDQITNRSKMGTRG